VVYNIFMGRGYLHIFVEVWFSDLHGYWRTRLSSCFGDIVLVGCAGFSLRISNDNKITEMKLCLMCIGDSAMIFVFLLHMFSINNFNVKVFNDNI
jgi:hypothetical protein